MLELDITKLDDMKPLPLHPTSFQELQVSLKHHPVIFESSYVLEYHEALAEFLKHFPMAVVLDSQTSWSRTCWLSGIIDEKPILVVIDSLRGQKSSLVTIDAWSNSDQFVEAIQGKLGISAFAKVSRSFEDIQIDWEIDLKTESLHQLIVSLTSELPEDAPRENLYVSVNCSDFVSEKVMLSVPLNGGVASISIELDWSIREPVVRLNEDFFTINITDTSWKPIQTAFRHSLTWRDVLETQIQRRLTTKKRFESFHELADSLGLSFHNLKDIVAKLFFNYCLEKTPQNCEKSRIDDYCQRAAILTGIVTCFNPIRGLSGYLDMLIGENTPDSVINLGGRRTWRSHISEVANLAEDFMPTPLRVTRSRKSIVRGRPPTQLMPKVPLLNLFQRFMNSPHVYICRNCRFID